jgi:hypothetical protein
LRPFGPIGGALRGRIGNGASGIDSAARIDQVVRRS